MVVFIKFKSETMGNPLDVKEFIRRHRYQSFFMGPLVDCRKVVSIMHYMHLYIYIYIVVI